MKKTKTLNLVEVTDCRFRQVMDLLVDWIASERDIPIGRHAAEGLKGWILYGSSYLRWDEKSMNLYLAFRARDEHNPRQLAYTVSKLEQFIMKRFSSSFSEFGDQGYKYGIQKGSEKYLFFAWRLPRWKENVARIKENETKTKTGVSADMKQLTGLDPILEAIND